MFEEKQKKYSSINSLQSLCISLWFSFLFLFLKIFLFFLLWLIYNVLSIFAVQQSDPIMCVCVCVCVCMHSFSDIILHHVASQATRYSFLCYIHAAGWFYFLCVLKCGHYDIQTVSLLLLSIAWW